MILLLMRHGIAEAIEEGSDLDDAQRELTKKGRKRVRDVARFLKTMGLKPDVYLSSPRIRAQQTALAVSDYFNAPEGPKRIDSLDFGGRWSDFVLDAGKATRRKKKSIILAAGHDPSIGEFLTEALVPVNHSIPFKKGAIAAVSWDGPIAEREGTLLFYITAPAARRAK